MVAVAFAGGPAGALAPPGAGGRLGNVFSFPPPHPASVSSAMEQTNNESLRMVLSVNKISISRYGTFRYAISRKPQLTDYIREERQNAQNSRNRISEFGDEVLYCFCLYRFVDVNPAGARRPPLRVTNRWSRTA